MSFAGLRVAAVRSDISANGTKFLVRVTFDHPAVAIAAANVMLSSDILVVDWGDGTVVTYERNMQGLIGYRFNQNQCIHEYSSPGDYIVTLSDTIVTLQFSVDGEPDWSERLVKILRWGTRLKELKLRGVPQSVGSFENCSNLEYVASRNRGFDDVSNRCFAGCTSLTKLPVIFGFYTYSLSCDGIFANSGISDLSSWPGAFSTFSIGQRPFQGVAGLQLDTLPGTVTALGDQVFAGSNLTSLDGIPSSVVSFGDRCFAGCPDLETAVIPDSVTVIGDDCFRDCGSLERVTANSLEQIGDYAFSDCHSLTTIAGLSMSSLDSLGQYCFSGCESLSDITSIQQFPGTVLPKGLFSGCSSITDASSVTNNTHITEWACGSLANIGADTITIPSRVTTLSCSTFGTYSGVAYESSSNANLVTIVAQGRTKAQVLDWSKVSASHRCTPLVYTWYEDPSHTLTDVWTRGGAPWGAGPTWEHSGGSYRMTKDINVSCVDGTLEFSDSYPIMDLRELRPTAVYDCCST